MLLFLPPKSVELVFLFDPFAPNIGYLLLFPFKELSLGKFGGSYAFPEAGGKRGNYPLEYFLIGNYYYASIVFGDYFLICVAY